VFFWTLWSPLCFVHTRRLYNMVVSFLLRLFPIQVIWSGTSRFHFPILLRRLRRLDSLLFVGIMLCGVVVKFQPLLQCSKILSIPELGTSSQNMKSSAYSVVLWFRKFLAMDWLRIGMSLLKTCPDTLIPFCMYTNLYLFMF
jgi:hypothetical protein